MKKAPPAAAALNGADRDQPSLAVIVISLRAPPELAEAVQSVLNQTVPVELVVVNSGGGDAAGLLAKMGIGVPVHETAERLFVGGARNVGIEKTRARWVSFLASDCLAAPGWAAERLRLHKEGASMVASAVLPDQPERIVAWAHHLLLFPRRLPGLAPREALRYGVSFDRQIFSRFGLFDRALATGEDTEFLTRIPNHLEPVWAPAVITLHRNARGVRSLLRDQAIRGHRYATAMRQLRAASPFRLAKESLRQPRRSMRLAEEGLTGRDLELAKASRWLLRLGSIAKALGILAEIAGLPLKEPVLEPALRRDAMPSHYD